MEIVLKYFDDFTPTQLQQLSALKELYTDWNSKINVISRKDISAEGHATMEEFKG